MTKDARSEYLEKERNDKEVEYDKSQRTIHFNWYSDDKKKGIRIPELRLEI